MIEFEHVAAAYGKRKIINDVSFIAESGEITVLFGKNGCGKSTLIRTVAGNLSYSGSILIDGTETKRLKPHERARRLAVMPQILRSPQITVRELVSYGRQPYTGISGILSKKDNEKVTCAIKNAGIEALADAYIDRISGGERQKAYFAMLLAQDTDNIILDEPGAFLDAEYMNVLCSFLIRAKENGKTVLTVLHDINRTLEIADKIAVFHENTVFTVSPQCFVDNQTAERLFNLRRFDCVDANGKATVLFR